MAKSSTHELTTELGATGTVLSRGFLKTDEFNPKLSGGKGVDTITRMRRDGMVWASAQVVHLPITSAKWTIVSDDEEAQEDLTEALFQRLNFKGHILPHALLGFDYGHEVMEKVWVEEDGKLWYKKLGHRDQATIYDWEADENGDLAGIMEEAF